MCFFFFHYYSSKFFTINHEICNGPSVQVKQALSTVYTGLLPWPTQRAVYEQKHNHRSTAVPRAVYGVSVRPRRRTSAFYVVSRRHVHVLCYSFSGRQSRDRRHRSASSRWKRARNNVARIRRIANLIDAVVATIIIRSVELCE